MKDNKQQKNAFILPFLLITVFFLSTIALFITSLIVANHRSAVREQYRLAAQLAADAGLDYGINQLSVDNAYTGTASEIDLQNTTNIRTTYEVSIADGALANRKIVSAIGRSYTPATSTTPAFTRKYDVELAGLTSSGASVVTGVGGLYLSNSAKIVGGDVFVNGEVSMINSAQIGLSTNPVTVSVANKLCPIPADITYPRLCNAGENDDPIDIQNTAHIYGTTKANHQTSTAGLSDPGLTAGVVSPLPLPTHDRAAQISAIPGDAAHNITGAAASCTSNNGTKTWLADTKITGDVQIEKNCKVTIQGNIWITGKVTMKQTGQIIVGNGLTTDPDIMIDGQFGLDMANGSSIVQNSSGKGGRVIAYYSRAACSPDCSDVTGADLFNSRNDVTIKLDNTANAAKTTLFSKWSRVEIANSGDIGALVGQTVALKNTGTVTFGTVVAGVTPVTTWVKRGYLRVYD